MKRFGLLLGLVVLCLILGPSLQAGKEGTGITVDKEKRTITIEAQIAPRKLPNPEKKPELDKIYPIEVIACWPYPKGQKAHETVVTFEVQPSAIHKGLVELGLKPGTPVMGESKEAPAGPEVNIYLEIPGPDGESKKLTMDKVLVDSRTGKPFPKATKFRFTGSVLEQPDPNKKDKVYGADLSGTLIVIFPVSDKTVFQTNWTMKEERYLKLETNTKNLPKEGTPVKLVLEVPK
jgi:hypothetical protein